MFTFFISLVASLDPPWYHTNFVLPLSYVTKYLVPIIIMFETYMAD